MKKLTWWCRLVGAMNLFLGVANLCAIAFAPSAYESGLPYAHQAEAAKAFVDGWMPFALDMVVIGVALLWISSRPWEQLGLVWVAVVGEALHGLADDLFLVTREYDAGGYLAFAVVHLAIVVTGVLFAHQATMGRRAATTPKPTPAAVGAPA